MGSSDTFELALAEMPSASFDVCDKWKGYCSALPFRDEVPLIEKIRLFSIPLAEFFRKRYPNIAQVSPSVYLAVIVIGVYLSRTYPIPIVLSTAAEMERDLGVEGIVETVRAFVKGIPNY